MNKFQYSEMFRLLGNSCLPAGRGVYLELGIWLLEFYQSPF